MGVQYLIQINNKSCISDKKCPPEFVQADKGCLFCFISLQLLGMDQIQWQAHKNHTAQNIAQGISVSSILSM